MRHEHNNHERDANRITLATLVDQIGDVTGVIIMGAVMGLLIAWLFINIVTGCGEIVHVNAGEPVFGECVLMPWMQP